MALSVKMLGKRTERERGEGKEVSKRRTNTVLSYDYLDEGEEGAEGEVTPPNFAFTKGNRAATAIKDSETASGRGREREPLAKRRSRARCCFR